MCGIIAVIGGQAAVRENIVNDGLARTSHRGAPSDQGYPQSFTPFPISLGTNRLPLVGGSQGTQPAISESGAVLCVHNGEVFNFRALAEEVGTSPELSSSDTTVLNELLDFWGIDYTLERIQWEGAFVAFNRTTETVTAARDHLGIKPLYFAFLSETIVFASELKALEPLGATIHEVPAGAFVSLDVWSPRQVTTTKWWDVDKSRSLAPCIDQIDAVEGAVRSAVFARVPNEPYAVMLSGGLDSSLMLTLAIARNPNVTAFVLYRQGSPDAEAARRLCRDLNVRLVEVAGEAPRELWQRAPDIVRIVESWEWHVVNHAAPMLSLMSAIVDAGLRIVLTGEGADELFFGYAERHADGALLDEVELEQRRRTRLAQIGRTNCQRLDRMSMDRTLECRVPFLDRDVVETALSISSSEQNQSGIPKALLKEAARRLLPSYIVDRPKLSFAKGAGYIYDQERGGGVFEWSGREPSTESIRSVVDRFPYRFPVERALVEHFVELGYHRAEFMQEATA